MNARLVITVIFCLFGSVALTGCGAGGTFFNEIERYVHHEGTNMQEFHPTLERWAFNEREKPGLLANEARAFGSRERNNGQEMTSSISRFRGNQRELLPTLKAPEPGSISYDNSTSLAYGGTSRRVRNEKRFPDEDD